MNVPEAALPESPVLCRLVKNDCNPPMTAPRLNSIQNVEMYCARRSSVGYESNIAPFPDHRTAAPKPTRLAQTVTIQYGSTPNGPAKSRETEKIPYTVPPRHIMIR